jgi:spermidine synthase
MAILWQKTVDQNRYEIRTAGKTRRLYTNGVCHSEFNPNRVFTGSIWDLLILPAWFYNDGEIRRVLVLGVGGGAVLLQLDRLLETDAIIGVDSDAIHLHLARKFFGSAVPGITLIEAEAGAWLDSYRSEPFDMIIDDLFVDKRREPVRAVPVDAGWSARLLRHLRPGGLLTVNFASREELLTSALFTEARFNRCFAAVFQLTQPLLDNYVGVFSGTDADSRNLRDRIMRTPDLQQAVRNRKLRYRIRQLK